MVTEFKYKQKILPKVFAFFIIFFASYIVKRANFYRSNSFYLLTVLSQVIIYLYYSSKRLMVTEEGIEEIILWNVLWRSVKWEEMEEAYLLSENRDTGQNSMQMMMQPLPAFSWFAINYIGGTMLKIIVTHREALYLNLREIKNSAELLERVKERVRFVRR